MTDTPPSNRESIGLADLKRALDPERSKSAVSNEEIVAYHHGELSKARAEEVRAVLAADPDWESALEDARDPEALAAQSGIQDEAKIDAAWQDFQRRLGEMQEPSDPGNVVEFRKPPAPAPTPPAPYRQWRIAAVFVVGVLLGTFFGRQILVPPGPSPADSNVRLVELEPLRPEAGPLLGNEDMTPFASMGGELLVLKLWPPTVLERTGELPATAEFRLLRGDADTVEFRGQAELQDDAYVASLPADDLESGEYRIELDLGTGDDPGTYQYELRWQVESP